MCVCACMCEREGERESVMCTCAALKGLSKQMNEDWNQLPFKCDFLE